ncbi:MAG: histidine triad nucleotide-binding protein [Lachnospiraceae bacterium]|nr:histidine triad nucleotide-binding protein [Lachnospiraceae bacterium]
MSNIGKFQDDCIFCKIIKGEIPSTKVYEDETVYAFRDINPQMPVHILVVPKFHIRSLAEVTEDNAEDVGKVLFAVKKIAEQEKLDKGFRVITNAGKEAGQTVDHLHFHILAGRQMGEGLV